MRNKTEKNEFPSTLAPQRLVESHHKDLIKTLENFFQEGYLSQPFAALDFATIALLADEDYDYTQRANAIVEYVRIMRFFGSVYEKLQKIKSQELNSYHNAGDTATDH